MDFTMCKGDDCPLKNKCRRYTEEPNLDYQSYFVDPPYIDDECDMFFGDKSEYIYKQLQDILNGNLKRDK
jgi:hypothetical protein